MDSARAILDELMGRDRNKLPTEHKNAEGPCFTDPKICKHYLCGFCPHVLFTNTKSDLGPCTKVHDDLCRSEYLNLPFERRQRYGYEEDFYRFCQRLLTDVEKKIKEKAEEEAKAAEVDLSDADRQRLHDLSVRIDAILKQVEQLGEEGRVDEAQQFMGTVDALRREQEMLVQSKRIPDDKRMKVCMICGALLVVRDTERRVTSHLEGRQHTTYQQIRDFLEEYGKRKEEQRNRSKDRERDKDRDRDRRRERDSDGNRRKERDSHRDRDRRDHKRFKGGD